MKRSVLAVLLLVLTSCANRKVNIVHTSSVDTSTATTVKHTQTNVTDNSKTVSQTNTQQKDSSDNSVKIFSDGSFITLKDSSGLVIFTGKADSVVVKGRQKSKKQTQNMTTGTNNFNKNQLTEDSSHSQKHIITGTKTKDVEVTTSWKLYLTIIAAIIIILVALYFYLRSIGIFTFGDAAKKVKNLTP